MYQRRLLAWGSMGTHAHTLGCGQIEPQLQTAIPVPKQPVSLTAAAPWLCWYAAQRRFPS